MRVAPTGFYRDPGAHHDDANLAEELVLHFKGLSILDLGCGNGFYVRKLVDHGIDACGMDGNPHTASFGERFHVFDLTEPLSEIFRRDAVLSLEVGEHIPAAFEEQFLDNIALACRDLAIVSWAVPGQGGIHHVNCRANAHIIEGLGRRGLRFIQAETSKLRSAASFPWFKRTLMLFRR